MLRADLEKVYEVARHIAREEATRFGGNDKRLDEIQEQLDKIKAKLDAVDKALGNEK